MYKTVKKCLKSKAFRNPEFGTFEARAKKPSNCPSLSKLSWAIIRLDDLE